MERTAATWEMNLTVLGDANHPSFLFLFIYLFFIFFFGSLFVLLYSVAIVLAFREVILCALVGVHAHYTVNGSMPT